MPAHRTSASCLAAAVVLLSGCATHTIPTGSNGVDKDPASVTAIGTVQVDGSESGASGSPAREISPHRTLPELTFPEIDDESVAIAERHPARTKQSDDLGLATHDLWHRLRSGFRLSNLEDQPGRVAKFENWYAKHPKYFDRLSQRAYWFLPYVLDQVEQRGMPSEIAILPAIESAFRPDATSRSRAAGLWQFIGPTGRRFGLRQDWWMDARRDLVQSTRAALDYLEYLSQEFDGDWELALAAYNAGEGGISRAIKKNKARKLPGTYSHLKLRRETAEYVPRLFAVRNILNDPDKFGITLQPLVNRPTLRVVDLKHQTDISVAASYLSLSRKQLHYLNLGYKRGITPPNGPHLLVVPANEADLLTVAIAKLNPSQRMQWAHHRVKRGENLGIIARAHGVNVQSIKQANGLTSNLIHPGQELRVPLYGQRIQLAANTNQNSSLSNRTHRITSGDTLWKISRQYDVSLPALMKWNKLSSHSTLYPGQTLIVRQ